MTPFFVKPYFDFGLFILRLLASGLLFYAHGLPKLSNFGERITTFADPLGLGSEITYLFAILAEVICAILVILGLFTRVAVIPIIITMLTAALVVHADDPFRVAELPLLFALIFFSIMITGPGKISLDAMLSGKRKLYRF